MKKKVGIDNTTGNRYFFQLYDWIPQVAYAAVINQLADHNVRVAEIYKYTKIGPDFGMATAFTSTLPRHEFPWQAGAVFPEK